MPLIEIAIGGLAVLGVILFVGGRVVFWAGRILTNPRRYRP